MARTFTSNEVTFIYRGDYSGKVTIITINNGLEVTSHVPFEALEDFVAESIRSRKLSELEQMTSKEIIEQLKV